MSKTDFETVLSTSASTSGGQALLELVSELSKDAIAELQPRVHAWVGEDVELVAPSSWVDRMVGGEYQPADALITSLELGDTKLSGAKIVKILKNPHLTHLRALDVGRLKVSNTFWKVLRGESSTRSLRVLRCGYITDRNSSQFDGEHHLEELQTLIIRHSSVVKDAHLHELLSAPMVSNVTRLVVELIEPDLVNWLLEAVRGDDVLPSLEQLAIVTGVGKPLRNIFDVSIARRVDRFEVRLRALYSDFYEQLRKSTEGGVSGPESLDISGSTIDPGHLDDYSDEDAMNCMNRALRMWQKPSQTKRITLGGWWNEEAASILESQGLEVTK